MGTLTIRAMTSRHVPAAGAMEAGDETGSAFAQLLPGWIRRKNHTGLVAERDGRLVGYLAYRFLVNEWRLILERIAVAPESRRRGVGRALVAQMFRTARNLEGSRISASVPESNVVCQLFLRACGFRAVGIVNRQGDEPHYEFEFKDTPDTHVEAPSPTSPLPGSPK